MVARVISPVPDELAGERVDRVVAVLGDLSRSAARRLVEAGGVRVDGETAAASTRLDAGQMVEFELPDDTDQAVSAEPVDFTVPFEDGHVVVVDKPAGLVVHPGAGRKTGTLVAGLLARYPEIEGVGQEGRWGIVHRLDRDTSGLLVVARSQTAYEGLSAQVRERSFDRHYLALVDDDFSIPTGTIDAPLSRDPSRPRRRRVDPAGKPARTHYELVERFPTAGVSLLRVTLETGRTHQIRVHLAAIDHPVVGDRLYRSGPDRVEAPRLFLHASALGFTHPVTGERMQFESDLPSELDELLVSLRRST